VAIFANARNVAWFVWKHPANEAHRFRAVLRAARFQARGRLLRRRTLARLGERSRVWADLHRTGASKVVYANPPDHPEMLVWRLQPGRALSGQRIGLIQLEWNRTSLEAAGKDRCLSPTSLPRTGTGSTGHGVTARWHPFPILVSVPTYSRWRPGRWVTALSGSVRLHIGPEELKGQNDELALRGVQPQS
jgi:hypothetical protein